MDSTEVEKLDRQSIKNLLRENKIDTEYEIEYESTHRLKQILLQAIANEEIAIKKLK